MMTPTYPVPIPCQIGGGGGDKFLRNVDGCMNYGGGYNVNVNGSNPHFPQQLYEPPSLEDEGFVDSSSSSSRASFSSNYSDNNNYGIMNQNVNNIINNDMMSGGMLMLRVPPSCILPGPPPTPENPFIFLHPWGVSLALQVSLLKNYIPRLFSVNWAKFLLLEVVVKLLFCRHR
jgi:hypothetical protein